MTNTGKSIATPKQRSPPINLTPIHIKRHDANTDSGGFCHGSENYNTQLHQVAVVAHQESLKPLNIEQVLTPAKFEPMMYPTA